MALAFGLDVVVWQPEGEGEAEGWDGTDSDYEGCDSNGLHSVRDQDVSVDPMVFARLLGRAAEMVAERRRERGEQRVACSPTGLLSEGFFMEEATKCSSKGGAAPPRLVRVT